MFGADQPVKMLLTCPDAFMHVSKLNQGMYTLYCEVIKYYIQDFNILDQHSSWKPVSIEPVQHCECWWHEIIQGFEAACSYSLAQEVMLGSEQMEVEW